MSMHTIPLAVPEDLLDEVRRTATEAQFSQADIMRQAIKAGLPTDQEKLFPVASLLGGLKPFPKAECKEAWGPHTDGGKSDRIADAMTRRPVP